MIYINDSFDKLEKLNTKKAIITIGNFDGFHIFHQKIINQVINIAKQENLTSIVMSFDKKIKNNKTYTNLATKKQKLEFINTKLTDLDYFIDIKVDDSLIKTTKDQFIDILLNKLNVIKIVEGQDFTFGYLSQGNINDLIRVFSKENVIIFKRDNDISSTKIKKLLDENLVDKAQELLGINLKLK
ncbi:FAD synthetase [Mycoplasma mycoides]|uniref:FAD synthetase n=1 Tax=Mycoplasma mycoides TaxID=2102 RepID=UPI000346F387|nr:FAD synthetase [Mycoplasma mycoides]EXU60253.1 Riboflavin kinase [Mycoplasma mycoides subsp. capri PG3]QVK04175.1 FAD synthetase [Mycoplasma mycoides subsp. capri]